MYWVDQEEIDTEAYKGVEVLDVDPIGGGVDVLYRVDILANISTEPYGKKLIQWKPSDETPDVSPGEGSNNNVHFVGVPHANDERVCFVECDHSGDYELLIPSFSEISSKVSVRRVFCAPLRPTTEPLTIHNPIKDITIPQSPDTVNLQIVALENPQFLTNEQGGVSFTYDKDVPCVFGFIYKHETKGDKGYSERITLNFDPKGDFSYYSRTFDAGGSFVVQPDHTIVRTGGVEVEKISFISTADNVHCKELAIHETVGTSSAARLIVRESDNLIVNNNEKLRTLFLNAGEPRLAGTVTFLLCLDGAVTDCALTIWVKDKNA